MSRASVASTQRLRELIEEATVDCYDEEEQATGLFTMIEADTWTQPITATLHRRAR